MEGSAADAAEYLDRAGGRAKLLASLSFTRRRVAVSGGDDSAIALGGWSRGGKAAAELAGRFALRKYPRITPA